MSSEEEEAALKEKKQSIPPIGERDWSINYDHLNIKELVEVIKKSNHHLPKRNYDYKFSEYNIIIKDIPHLRAIVARIDQGTAGYSDQTVQQLRDILDSRGIQTESRRLKRSEIIELLMRAHFPHFMELPPEIRVMVYKYTMQSVADAYDHWKQPSEPALFHVSSTVRAEALPVFFSSSIFLLDISRHWDFRRNVEVEPSLCFNSRFFLRGTNSAYVKLIRRLRVRSVSGEWDLAFRSFFDLSAKVVIKDKVVHYIKSPDCDPLLPYKSLDQTKSSLEASISQLADSSERITGSMLSAWSKQLIKSTLVKGKNKTIGIHLDIELL